MNLRSLLPILSICIGFTGNLSAAGLIIVSQPGQADQLVGPRPGAPLFPPGRVLELARHDVDVKIVDQFAVTHIEQDFRNPTSRRLEGTFLLPVPRGAQLKTFAMEINGKSVEAELLAAPKARKIYEDIVRRQRDPALLEFMGRDLYKVRIFPIEPHETKRIALSYEQLLKTEFGLVSFEYPMSVEKFSAKPVDRLNLNISLKTGKPLKTVYSPTHDVEVVRKGERHVSVGYESLGTCSESDFELFFSREDEGVGMSLLTFRPDPNEDGYFALLVSPGLVESKADVLPKDVVFVMDTSGSMANGKLEQARNALVFCIENLNERDRFEVVQFATDVNPLFGGLSPVEESSRRKALEYVNRLKPRGGTAIDHALSVAMEMRGKEPVDERPFIVVFLTDGQPTVGENNIDTIVAHVADRKGEQKRVFCFGIGNDVNTVLLDRITEETGAASEYVLPREDLELKVSNFFAKIKDPVLMNPQLDFPDGIRATRIHPSPLPDVFSGEQLVVVGRYARGASGAVKLSGRAGEESVGFAEDAAFAKQTDRHDFIERLWATRRIGWLVNEIRLRGENDELKKEITLLAREHGIVTPYTAWLIVEDEERRGVQPALRTLRQNSRNQAALDYSEANFRNLSKQQTGEDAALSARYGAAAARRTTAAGPVDSLQNDEVFLRRYGLSAPASQSRNGGRNAPIAVTPTSPTPTSSVPVAQQVLPSELSGQSRVIVGKTFFENDGVWIDAEIQKHPDARRVVIKFNSDEYFRLIGEDRRFAQWATLGNKMQFYHDGTIYTIE